MAHMNHQLLLPEVNTTLTVNKVKLTIPLVAGYLSQGYSQGHIARQCKVTSAAVCRFIKRNYDDILPVLDTSDKYLALKAKHLGNKAIDRIDKILDVSDFTKRDLVSLNIVAGTSVDKYRLLTGKSTDNITIHNITDTIDSIKKRKEELQKAIDSIT
jgi:hypothetical protein